MGGLLEGRLLSRKNKAARFNFAREHFWKSILWTDESKIEFLVTIKTALFGEKTTIFV